jgi:type IV pilus assembly protein PilC
MTFFEPRIGLKPLAALCRRLTTSLGAGVDVRTVFAREASATRGAGRSRFSEMSEAVDQGTSIAGSLNETGQYFPDFFRELVQVGEQSGHLPEVFRQLAEHYEHQLKLRRVLLAAITWPLLELFLALSVVGLLIWLMGAIPTLQKNKIDLLGFGLTGTSGLLVYLGFLGVVAVVGFLIFRATMRGVLWVAPVQRAIMSAPGLGRTLQTLAIARLAWAMHVTLNSGMDLRPALKMSLQSTHNVIYTQHIDRILSSIRFGNPIHEALRAAGVFPIDFLDSVQVGEESGQLVESMAQLADQYQDQARLAMNTLTILLGLAVTAVIAGVIIFLIFRVFSFYTGTLNDALKMRP